MSNFEPTSQQEELSCSVGTTAASTSVNTPTKAELLNRAKAAIEAGDQSMHEAAEALAVAQEFHSASQADMARAIGKSEAWVSMLLQWRRAGYKDESPFGPTTKAARLKHAKDRAASGVSTSRKPRKQNTTPVTDDSAAPARDAVVEISISKDAKASTRALAEFKEAVNCYVPKMGDADKEEAKAYFLKKAGVAVS